MRSRAPSLHSGGMSTREAGRLSVCTGIRCGLCRSTASHPVPSTVTAASGRLLPESWWNSIWGVKRIRRSALVEEIASRIADLSGPEPVLVAIDGVDGAGKTTLADELVDPVGGRGRPVIRASIDSFHNPQSVRYRMGRHSPEGYFRDSFNHDALIESLLIPLSAGGTRRYRRAVFDHTTDSTVAAPLETADDGAVLLFDGIFVHRPELVSYWDFTIFLDARFDVTVPRSALRFSHSPDVGAEDNRRYVEGQKLYMEECGPRSLATMVVDNNDFENPRIVEVRRQRKGLARHGGPGL